MFNKQYRAGYLSPPLSLRQRHRWHMSKSESMVSRNHQQSHSQREVGESQGGEGRVHEQAARGEKANNGGAFEQFQPVPDPDLFQQEDPLGGISTAMAGVEAPTDPTGTPVNPSPAATATAEAGIGINEATTQTSRQAEPVSSVDNDGNGDEEGSTM
ncbi:hypothetical protein KEM55_004041 [Ascosphaera atra]|nr:hypothetical protein KEM55_004041 [Ascosphaera atra]